MYIYMYIHVYIYPLQFLHYGVTKFLFTFEPFLIGLFHLSSQQDQIFDHIICICHILFMLSTANSITLEKQIRNVNFYIFCLYFIYIFFSSVF